MLKPKSISTLTFFQILLLNPSFIMMKYAECVLNGQLDLNGTPLYFLDMRPENPVTPGLHLSLYVELDSEAELD
ncbi:hypothetical protein [Candidatus Enterococcus lemimoniae]|uniref:hypothetical protein n=1 Tax=Candidatus Enterococcus lemimoniae TaxID=1834167 RepID=UPI0011212D2D|nr:hypothetical protein [Enterococcus sp. 12C11_DIV0727]